MIQIKKTILTLVALLAVTTGAWATDVITVTWSSGDTYENNNSKDGVTLSGENVRYDGSEWQLAFYEGKGTFTTELGNFTNIEINGGYIYGFSGEGWSGRTWTGNAAAVPFNGFITDDFGEDPWTITFTIEPASSAPSGPTVDWDKATKTGTFTMPGGNVELEPEYYPQAVLTAVPTAINDVPATTDGAIVNAGTVKNIGETTNAQGTVMYYVSPTALDDAALLALDADAWTADVPTAQSFTAAGTAYVYYYVRGNDGDTDDEIFSDGDILATNKLTVTIAAAPTYAVTFADDTAEPDKWSASPAADVKKGETVTVTYSGSKKVLGVKAEKKSAAVMTTVTWNSSNVFNSAHEDVELDKWSPTPLTYEGITISFSGTKVSHFQAYDEDDHIGSLTCYGNNGDSFTFTAPSGKKFCKIEIINNGFIVFTNYDDWTRDADNKIVWSGTAANAVTLGSVYTDADNLNSIVFYLSE